MKQILFTAWKWFQNNRNTPTEADDENHSGSIFCFDDIVYFYGRF